MILQALLVSRDEATAETLIQVLAQFGVAVDRTNAFDVAVTRLSEERFDQVIVDFDDPAGASSVLEACRQVGGPGNPPITVALLQDASQIRSILGAGAHFILTKPVTPEQAQNTLRAATAMLKRERRQSLRVAVQAAVTIRVDDNTTVEGILLDLKGRGVLESKKGKGGGYQLNRPPSTITIGSIIRLLEGPLAPLPCASETAFKACEECQDIEHCGTRMIMRQVRDSIAAVLDKTTLSELIRQVDAAKQEHSRLPLMYHI